MPDYTSKLALAKPRGGSSGSTPAEQVDIDVLNGNFDKLDAASGDTICTSTTRPAAPYDGQQIFETDTRRSLVYWNSTWNPVYRGNLMNWSGTGPSGGGSWSAANNVVPLIQMGQTGASTDSGGRLNSTFPAPFPNGIAGVVLMLHNNSNALASSLPTLVEGTVSKTGFQTIWGGRASTTVFLPYMAIGW
jgi:hypothetical protein